MKFCFNLLKTDTLIEMNFLQSTWTTCNLKSQMIVDDEKFMNKIL